MKNNILNEIININKSLKFNYNTKMVKIQKIKKLFKLKLKKNIN